MSSQKMVLKGYMQGIPDRVSDSAILECLSDVDID